MATKLNKVLVNVDQSDKDKGGFTDSEKAQARANIGAISIDEVPTAVQSNWTQSDSSKIDYIKNKPVSKGDSDHPVYIDESGKFRTSPKLVWSYEYKAQIIQLTQTDINNKYFEFSFPLGESGLQIANTNCLLLFKGAWVTQQYTPITWNKQCSLYMVDHNNEDPRMLLSNNVETYASSPAGNSWWYDIKAYGITYNNNGSKLDIRLRVPILDTENPQVGDEKVLGDNTAGSPTKFNITIFGKLPYDDI